MKVVSFSRVVPYEGIPHAGGEYYLQHLRHLASEHDVIVVAPDSPRNRSALAQYNCPAPILLIGSDRPKSLLGKLIVKVLDEARPASAPMSLMRALRSNDELRRALHTADVAEFQWSENGSLSSSVIQLNARIRIVTVMHDVLQQKFLRRVITERKPKRRVRALLGMASAYLLEPRRLRRSDTVIVLSEKDRALVAKSATSARIAVVPPPLQADLRSSDATTAPYSVLFTGAMDRPENDQGILWFIENCWPTVRSALPAASLVVAGASPSPSLLKAASEDASINVTGFVHSLEPFYMSCGLFIVPLFQGAGVKFKTIAAMLHGLPVVSTEIGAEGVGTVEHFASITNNADQFARSVIEGLTGSPHMRAAARTGQEWALSTYGLAQFKSTLSEVYATLAEDGISN